MGQVLITKDALLIKKDGNKKYRRAKKLTVLTYLRDSVEIAEGVTLRDLFRIVSQYKLLKLFISQYSWCRQLEEFHAQAEEPMRDDEKDKLEYLEIYWHASVHKYKKETSFDVSVGFHGIGTPDRPENAMTADGKTHYSVSYSPMYELADLPLKLNTALKIWGPWEGKPPQKVIFEGKKDYCLLDVLDAIYWDISFMGGPAENSEFIEEMNGRVDDIKAGIAKCIPAEEVFKELGMDPPEKKEGGFKVMLSPEVVAQLGLNPDDFEGEELPEDAQ